MKATKNENPKSKSNSRRNRNGRNNNNNNVRNSNSPGNNDKTLEAKIVSKQSVNDQKQETQSVEKTAEAAGAPPVATAPVQPTDATSPQQTNADTKSTKINEAGEHVAQSLEAIAKGVTPPAPTIMQPTGPNTQSSESEQEHTETKPPEAKPPPPGDSQGQGNHIIQKPKSMKLKPIKWNEYDIKFRSKFYSMYSLGQTDRGLTIGVIPTGIKIGKYTNIYDFYLNALPNLVYELEEKYGGILHSVPAQKGENEPNRHLGNPTIGEAIGINFDTLIPLLKDVKLQAQLRERLFSASWTNQYLPPEGSYTLESAVSIQAGWERDLQQFLHNSEFQLYFSQLGTRGDSGIADIVHRIFNYVSLFNGVQQFLNPTDTTYEGKFTSVGALTPFIPINTNHHILMQTNMVYRSYMLNTYGELFKDCLTYKVDSTGESVISAAAANLAINTTMTSLDHQMLRAISKLSVKDMIWELAIVMMNSAMVKIQWATIPKMDFSVIDVFGAILERVLLPRKIVTDAHAWWSAVVIVTGLLSFFNNTPGVPEFTRNFWIDNAANRNFIDPIDTVLRYLHPDVQAAVKDYFGEGQLGEGWAGAGLNPGKRVALPASCVGMTAATFYEPWYGMDVLNTYDPRPTEQLKRLVTLSGVLLSKVAYSGIGVSSRSGGGIVNTIVKTLNFLTTRVTSVSWMLSMLNKLNYMISLTPLAMSCSDEKAFTLPQYTSNETDSFYERLSSTTARTRTAYQLGQYKDTLTTLHIPSEFAYAFLLSENIIGPYDIQMPIDLIFSSWEINKALLLLGKHTIYGYQTSKKLDGVTGYDNSNIRWTDVRKNIFERFDKEKVDDQYKSIIKTCFTGSTYTYPPLEGCAVFMDRINKFLSVISEEPETFGFTFQVYYGGVQPTTAFMSEDASRGMTNHLTFVNVNSNMVPSAVIREPQLRLGANALNTWNLAEEARKTGQIILFQTPLPFDINIPSGEMVQLVSTYDINYITDDPILLTTGPYAYTFGVYKLRRAYRDVMHTTLFPPMVKNPTWMIERDPVVFFNPSEFVETADLFGTSNSLVFLNLATISEFKSRINPTTVVTEFNNVETNIPYFAASLLTD